MSISGNFISDADLEKTVRIDHRSIELYPGEFFAPRINLPRLGRGLNRKALLKFKNFCHGKCLGSKADMVRKMKAMCVKNEMHFVDYDPETNLLVIKVFGF